jgi:hypothetical protein
MLKLWAQDAIANPVAYVAYCVGGFTQPESLDRLLG